MTSTAAKMTRARADSAKAEQQLAIVRTAAAGAADSSPVELPEMRTVNDFPAVLAAIRSTVADVRAHADADVLALAETDDLPAELTAAHANTAAYLGTLCSCVDALARILA